MDNHTNHLQPTIATIKEAIEMKSPLAFAANYADLLFGEKAKLLSPEWCKDVNVAAGIAMLKSMNDLFVGQWLGEFESLMKILAYPGRFESEEIIKILTLRSALESAR